MPAKDAILDFDKFDLNNVIADIDDIRAVNPQRHEMEQLTAVVHDDPDANICVGYKDVTESEFWVRGHMPEIPLMPGVIMCEAAAQLCSYHTQRNNLLGCDVVGFGGMEEVRFRDPVFPGSRLVLMGKLLKLRPGVMIVSRFQGFIERNVVVEGIIKGIALPLDQLQT